MFRANYRSIRPRATDIMLSHEVRDLDTETHMIPPALRLKLISDAVVTEDIQLTSAKLAS